MALTLVARRVSEGERKRRFPDIPWLTRRATYVKSVPLGVIRPSFINSVRNEPVAPVESVWNPPRRLCHSGFLLRELPADDLWCRWHNSRPRKRANRCYPAGECGGAL